MFRIKSGCNISQPNHGVTEDTERFKERANDVVLGQ